ncbi:MAG: sugar phosphate isomerase/epimerase [Phycisphaerales bacterium]|nr:MAG: sugar phosphate isomerase/epimerase [Phycisphaerales bacterium]
MSEPTIGVDVDDLRLGVKSGLRTASALEFRSVELATVAGEVAPANLSSSGRRHLSHFVKSLGLELSSLTADIPGLRIADPSTVGERVERTCQIIELAADLNVPVVSASLGAITHPDTQEPSPHALDALRRIGEFADSRGRVYALRPSVDSCDQLAGVLDLLNCPALGVSFDPAGMIMVGTNPFSSIERLIEQIAVIQARDGTVGGTERTGHETPLGEGDVDWESVLAVLRAAEYDSPLVLRRTDSQRPIEDIQRARDVLTRMLWNSH